MRPARSLQALIAAALCLLLAAPPPATAHTCITTPTYDDTIPSPSEAIPGFPLRRALTSELNDYVDAVAATSDRVRAGTFASSWNGTPLKYALVSLRPNMADLDSIVARLQRLRDPRRTTPREAAAIASTTPAIVWYTGNVHGNEASGADAAIHLLYELAAGRYCDVEHTITDLIVGIIPTQNPDGRDAASRENAYGFDMNRDWFARTQPETDGKLDLLMRFPPVLFIDAHEMGSSDFFFPPNADPIHHEISPESLRWINELYGPAMAKAFEDRRATAPTEWSYFNYDIYDLFYMGYGDTVPTTVFTAAGMTFEKGTADTDAQREDEQFVAGWTSIFTAGLNKRQILLDWHQAHARAYLEGRAGFLEPNVINEPGNVVDRRVPPTRVRHYFIGPERSRPDAARLVERLISTGVEVYRLRRPLSVPNLRAYGRGPRRGVVPAGSFWIPMAQPQKRWIQALLGEDPYTPFAYFYDVTAWSNPLLMNLPAWFTGDRLRPRAERVVAAPVGSVRGLTVTTAAFGFPGDTGEAMAAAWELARTGHTVRRLEAPAAGLPRGSFVVLGAHAAPALRRLARERRIDVRALRTFPEGLRFRQPRIAVYAPPAPAGAAIAVGESIGHLRYLLDRVWKVPYTPVTGAEILLGALSEADVLLVPGIETAELTLATPVIESWIAGGGVYVGTARPGGSGGTGFAIQSGFTTAAVRDAPELQVPGTMFRVLLGPNSPLTLGAPTTAYWYQLGDDVLEPSVTGTNAGLYPSRAPEFWSSGYVEGQAALAGSAALVDETLGAGRVLLFSSEPNYRAYTDGASFLLANAIAYPVGAFADGTDVASPIAARAVAAAMASARSPIGPGRPIRIVVPAAWSARAAGVLRDFGAENLTVRQIAGAAYLTIPNPLGLDVERHPFVYRILRALREASVPVRSAIL